MHSSKTVGLPLFLFVSAGWMPGQTVAKVDFSRDVLPLFRQNCVGCHGPTQQISGLRLDRRSSVMKSGLRRIVPGSSENSFLYFRLNGTEYGPQMPPTGALRPEQIATMKAWIDQGADWPDALANEVDLPPFNPKAMAMVQALRANDIRSFLKSVKDDPKLLNTRGPNGSTPFMYAVLYADAKMLAGLLKQGADPNAHNDANITALLWAATDLEKTRLLLDHGANVNARSDDLRTALMVAARRPGGLPIVKLLLDRGAKPNPNSNPATESSPLTEAATAGDAEVMQLLMERGADAKAAGQPALTMAITLHCTKCLDVLAAKNPDRDAYSGALQDTAVFGDIRAVRVLLEHGADVKTFDALGRTALMYAAGSDVVPADVVKLLIENGADVNARSRHANAVDTGLTVLDVARLRGETPVVELLVNAGAKTGTAAAAPAMRPARDNTVRNAVQTSIPLLQKADANFVPKAGCVSCHNNSLEAMTVGVARRHGYRVDEQVAARQVQANVLSLEKMRDRLQQGFFVPVGDNFGPFILAYMLIGLDAEHHKADLNTDIAAMYLKRLQATDGQWVFPHGDTRPPMCSLYIGQTALSMRALQLYAPKTDKAGYDKSIQLAAAWLANAQSQNNDDRGWRLLGLAWAGTDKAATKTAMQELLAVQRADGGWSDIASMESSAYATGKALSALQAAGLPVSDPVYERGVRFLLKTQQQDGSWYVKTRALAFQPYFDAGYPHGFDQWISAAGSSWAAMALALASPEPLSAKR
ncbi:MAG: ankyrin repeat domain-containing protein [Bryobacteraceae bacterium]